MRTLASLAILSGLLSAQTKVTSVEGITEYRLDNGLKVLLFPDNSKPTVTVNVTYLVGSRHEGYGETGMAHLLEHMMFKGTAKAHGHHGRTERSRREFNGSTVRTAPITSKPCPPRDENLQWALDMEADRMVNSRVSRQDLDSEMTVVRNEFESGENSPGRILEERVLLHRLSVARLRAQPHRSRSDIEKVPIETLQAFYRNYYQPDNAMLVVAGKFDPDKTLGWIKDTFGAIPKPTRTLYPTYTEEPTQDGEREVVLRRVGESRTGDDGVSRSGWLPSRSRRAGRARRRSWAKRPPAGSIRLWWKPRKPLPPAPSKNSCTTRASSSSTRERARTAIWTTRKRPC